MMRKISYKFNLLLILSVTVSVFISSLATTTYLLYTSEKDTHEKNLVHIKGLADNISSFLDHATTLNYQLSMNSQIVNSLLMAEPQWEKRVESYNRLYNTSGQLGPESGLPILSKMQEEYNFVELFFLQDLKGDQTARSFGPLGHRGDRWWFKLFLERGTYKPFVSKSYYSMTGNIPVSSVFHPVYHNNLLIGILGMDINFSQLQSTVEGYLKADYLYSIVLDNEGVIIAHPDTDKIREMYNLVTLKRYPLKSVVAQSGQSSAGYHETDEWDLDWDAEISQAARKATSGQSGFLRNIQVEDVESSLYYEPIPIRGSENGNGYYAVFLVHDKTGIARAKNIIFFTTLFFILAVIILLYLLFHSQFRKIILQPLRTLIDSMRNLDLENFKSLEVKRDDEFCILTDTYNNLVTGLSKTQRELVDQMEKLSESEAGYKALADIGISLSTEKDIDRLLELILDEARTLSRAEGGTLYIYDKVKKELRFEILGNEALGIRQGGTSGVPATLPSVPLFKEGKENYSNVSSYAALTGKLINIPDVYHTEGFDFSGMREYDVMNKYHSQSMIVLPMKNVQQELIGVIQLINARKKNSQEIIPFPEELELVLTSLAAQAAVALTNFQLSKDLEKLLYAFIEGIATAVDEKSHYTGDHIKRVVILTMMIAEKINTVQKGVFKDRFFSDMELEELKLSALMHDIGKISTPENLMDKSSKLQRVMDGIDLIKERFARIRESLKVDYYEALSKGFDKDTREEAERILKENLKELEEDFQFLRSCNDPEQRMDQDKIRRLKTLAGKTYQFSGETCPCLTEQEVRNLLIQSGTLNEEERRIIENHAAITKKILDPLPFPSGLEHIPEYASMHHEKLDGSGYPKGLKEKEIPLQARIIAISDIFEALTAPDRPYRKPLDFSEALSILERMKRARQIDPDIFDLIMDGGLGREYSKNILNKSK